MKLKELGSKDRRYGTLAAIMSLPSGIPGVVERYYFYMRGKHEISMIPAGLVSKDGLDAARTVFENLKLPELTSK